MAILVKDLIVAIPVLPLMAAMAMGLKAAYAGE